MSQVADKIGPFVEQRGEPLALLAQLQATDHGFGANDSCSQALVELTALFKYGPTRLNGWIGLGVRGLGFRNGMNR